MPIHSFILSCLFRSIYDVGCMLFAQCQAYIHACVNIKKYNICDECHNVYKLNEFSWWNHKNNNVWQHYVRSRATTHLTIKLPPKPLHTQYVAACREQLPVWMCNCFIVFFAHFPLGIEYLQSDLIGCRTGWK